MERSRFRLLVVAGLGCVAMSAAAPARALPLRILNSIELEAGDSHDGAFLFTAPAPLIVPSSFDTLDLGETAAHLASSIGPGRSLRLTKLRALETQKTKATTALPEADHHADHDGQGGDDRNVVPESSSLILLGVALLGAAACISAADQKPVAAALIQ
jgi:hypothetical protein